MQVVILCGGEGTRLRDVSEALPKPMFPIGGKPIVWHIMKYYASFGLKKFILCLGYRNDIFVDYFLNYHSRNSDVTVRLSKEGNIQFHNDHGETDWEVTLANTGSESMTGHRVFQIQKYLTEENFLLTYGDGLSTVDIKKLIGFHLEHKKLVTMSAVHPSGRFGEMDVSNNRVLQFNEKPQTGAGYINGGYMVLHRDFICRYLTDDPTLVLEHAPLIRAAQEGEIMAHCHDGFWQCMDTPREYKFLNSLWDSGEAPWKKW